MHATSMARALGLEFFFRAQTTVGDGGADRFGFVEGSGVDALVAGITDLGHAPDTWDSWECVSHFVDGRTRVVRVGAVLHFAEILESVRRRDIAAAAHFVFSKHVGLPAVRLVAFARVVTTTHDLVLLVLTVVHLVVTGSALMDLFRMRVIVFLEAHARVVVVVLAVFVTFVNRKVALVVALAPVGA